MEKRDIIVIVVAILIVLIMAMYIKPLVTGKEAKFIPDEISNLFKNDNVTNNSNIRDEVYLTNDKPQNYLKPSIKSITPNETNPNSISKIEIEGNNLKNSMEILVFSDSLNNTINTTLENDKLIGKNVSLPKGEWIVKILDPELNITYNTQHVIHVVSTPTPEPTWNGNSQNIVGELLNPITIPTRVSVYTAPTPQPLVYSDIVYASLEGNRSLLFEPINISTGYWKLSYTVDFTPNIANPTSDNIFEFNKQYKEKANAFEGDPEVIYDSFGHAIDIKDTKSKKEIEKKYSSSSENILVKKPVEGWKLGEGRSPFTSNEGTLTSSLVETVSYGVPDITIIIRNLDHLEKPPVIVKPDGGIDPLQWNKALYEQKADNDLEQKGITKSGYEDELWEKKWKSIKDPRPWTEKIFGDGSYSIEVLPSNIDKYYIDIMIPTINTTHISSIKDMDEISMSKSEIILTDLSFEDMWRNNPKYLGKIVRYTGYIVRKEDKNTYIFKPDSWNSEDLNQNIVLTDLNQINLKDNDRIAFEGIIKELLPYQKTRVMGSSITDKGMIDLPSIQIKSVKLEGSSWKSEG